MVDDETALWDPIEENSFFRLINVNDQMSSSLSDLVKDLRFEEDVLEDIKQDLEMFRFNRSKLGVLMGWVEIENEDSGQELLTSCQSPVINSIEDMDAFVNRVLAESH